MIPTISPWFYVIHFLVALIVFHNLVSEPTGEKFINDEGMDDDVTHWVIKSKRHLLQSLSISLYWEICLAGVIFYFFYMLFKHFIEYWKDLIDDHKENTDNSNEIV